MLTDPATTPAYRVWVRRVVADAHSDLNGGASAYCTLLLSVAPVSAAHDEELVKIVKPSDDAALAGIAART